MGALKHRMVSGESVANVFHKSNFAQGRYYGRHSKAATPSAIPNRGQLRNTSRRPGVVEPTGNSGLPTKGTKRVPFPGDLHWDRIPRSRVVRVMDQQILTSTRISTRP